MNFQTPLKLRRVLPFLKKIAFLMISLSVSGCTTYYKPVSEWEAEAMKNSTNGVYPEDVRNDLLHHSGTQIAWAGLIEQVEISETSLPAMMTLRVQHRYFSWKMDGTTKQFWLSPKGEGTFLTSWKMKPEWDSDQMRSLILPEDMVVVYGKPQDISDDGTIKLGEAFYIRHFPKAAYRDDVIEYGRPGEPSKILKVF